jgi:hypothetical protein
MSSGVLRVAYELMQTRFSDASWRYRTLDDNYSVHGGKPFLFIAIHDHVPSGIDSREIEAKVNDVLQLRTYEKRVELNLTPNGYSYVNNYRTGQNGSVPNYKIKRFVT